MIKVSYQHESIRLTGRWDTTSEAQAVTTTPGAYLEFAFEGRMAMARFDISANETPYLHLWVQVDGGVMTEAPIDYYLRVIAPDEGRHICRIVYKGGSEVHRRWYAPLHGKVSFLGVYADNPVAIGEDTRRTIEFVGDSITEGVLIDAEFSENHAMHYDIDQQNRVFQDDACASYAWLTAQKLNLRPIYMGYGAVGVTRSGQGKVPAAPIAYPYNFDGSPITRKQPDIVLLNHGANDRHKPVELYLEKYGETLDIIRKMNPGSLLVSVSPFCGAFHTELGEFVADYNRKNGCQVHYIDASGWVSPEPLHPMRDGHNTIADHLAPLLSEIIEKNMK